MAGWPSKKNAAFTVTFPIFDNDGDLVAGAAALDSEVSKDGGDFTDCTNEAAEIATSSGMYTLVLTSTEMNADIIATITKTTTPNAKTAPNVMYSSVRQIDDLAFPNVSGRGVDVDASGGVEVGSHQTGAITAAAFAAGAIDNAAFNVTETLTANPAAGGIVASSFGAGAIDANALAADAVTELRSLVSGTADSGSTTTMVDAARTEADADYWKGLWILFTSGTITGQVRLITGFDPATDTITFFPATTQAVGTNTYEILPNARIDIGQWLGVTPNALISGRVDSNMQALAADVITAAALAADAGTEIGTAVWASATRTLTALGFTLVTGDFTAGFLTAALIATGAVDADALATDAVNEIADGLMTRASSNWKPQPL